MTTQTYSFAAEIAESHEADILEADELLREICQTGRRPTFAEATFFQRLGWDTNRVTSEVRRMNSVLRFRAIAGTMDDRAAATAEAATASKVAETELPKLQLKREKLEAEERRIATERDRSVKRVSEQTEAVDGLRGLVPQHIVDQVNAAVNLIKSTLGKEISDAAGRINELECCLSPSRYPNENAYLEMLHRSFRAAVSVADVNRILRRKLSPEWPQIRLEIEAELVELNGILPDMKQNLVEALAAAKAPLSYYAV